ncbi:inorganic diphosphatase [Mesomycoplasma hyorhinis]|uniref:inorganic diphosphatase n=1 Tax=Mesomycoplasma hyorhinis TaxID=2100 RepID=UPI001C04F56B|nr:inorganic diphosphatase [Mesomycoplasma hyorhinis]
MKKNIINVDIEISLGSNIKYEFDRKAKKLVVDRILRAPFVYPANYGAIKNTLDWDGDELDVLVYSKESFVPGVQLKARVIGAMKMVDDGEIDTKLIAVHEDDYRLSEIQTLKDLPSSWLSEVEYFFSNYKNWKRAGITSVDSFEDAKWALEELAECEKLFSKYSKLSKKDFIKKMKEKHPEKYL